MLPLKWSGFPFFPSPFSPVHSALKFSAVLGSFLENSSISILSWSSSPILMSRNTFVFSGSASFGSSSAAYGAFFSSYISIFSNMPPKVYFSCSLICFSLSLISLKKFRISWLLGSNFIAAIMSVLASSVIPVFSLACALRNRAFWLLGSFSNTLPENSMASCHTFSFTDIRAILLQIGTKILWVCSSISSSIHSYPSLYLTNAPVRSLLLNKLFPSSLQF